jgi:putative DNA modification/repair radical SAM protein
MNVMDKLTLLTDAAKYDVACTSSGASRSGRGSSVGNAVACGICHSFAGDGRCISLLKVLQSSACRYDCAYCVNRRSNDTPRATFQPRELADLTLAFYRRNYIEGLFLSSGVAGTADHTCELMLETMRILRDEYRFGGYIHCKAIPGADPALIERMGLYADRMSVNIELPSQESLRRLAPEKNKENILLPMRRIAGGIQENSRALTLYRHAPKFAPAGQSTQMIVGASPESDRTILTLAEALYGRFSLKRVFYSAYIPLNADRLLPPVGTPPPLLREHRLYQADWLLRFYGFKTEELLDERRPNLDPALDPKCNWAVGHLDQFPVDVNRAPYELLLRIPGVGVKSAGRILQARKQGALDFEALRKIGVVLKRAQHFATCSGKPLIRLNLDNQAILTSILSDRATVLGEQAVQLSLLDPTEEDVRKCLTGQI